MAKRSVKSLMYIFLLSVIGLALTPTIQEYVSSVTHATNGTAGFPAGGNNLTGGARTILTLFPLFWTILMIAIPVASVALYLGTTGD